MVPVLEWRLQVREEHSRRKSRAGLEGEGLRDFTDDSSVAVSHPADDALTADAGAVLNTKPVRLEGTSLCAMQIHAFCFHINDLVCVRVYDTRTLCPSRRSACASLHQEARELRPCSGVPWKASRRAPWIESLRGIRRVCRLIAARPALPPDAGS